jgi:hypothetical protein
MLTLNCRGIFVIMDTSHHSKDTQMNDDEVVFMP